MELGKKLKEARMNSGLTQEQAAEKLMVTRQTISNWENEKSLPDIISVINMSDLYHISLDDLLKGNKEMIAKIEKDSKTFESNKRLILVTSILVFIVVSIRLISTNIGGALYEFVEAATPWVLMGIGVACACAYMSDK
ncbi:MAG: helix-turn-helix transcriptional regulator [Erysipelotrichales bacterium]|nr:helix-turn-helix transcriptional regulator [Erysipelotrichales bacterium]